MDFTTDIAPDMQALLAKWDKYIEGATNTKVEGWKVVVRNNMEAMKTAIVKNRFTHNTHPHSHLLYTH